MRTGMRRPSASHAYRPGYRLRPWMVRTACGEAGGRVAVLMLDD